jgi:hypothetical protein
VNVKLDEGAGQLLLFPRCGLLARAKADDRVLPAHRLARPQGDVLDDAVTLVEDSKHRDALRHRRDPALPGGGRGDSPPRGSRRNLVLRAAPAGGERERNQQRCGDFAHFYSGIQGS